MIFNSTIIKSKGITIPEWTIATASNIKPSLIAYGDGMFVAIGRRTGFGPVTYIAGYSTDGVTWTTVTLPVTAEWTHLVYGNGMFVAVDSKTNLKLVYSTDRGATWNRGTYPSGYSTDLFGYGGGKFIIGGISANDTYSSTDCITWTDGGGPSIIMSSLAYGNGMFVGMQYGAETKFGYSYNGKSWTTGTMPEFTCKSMAYGDGMFVAIGKGRGAEALYSADGITWNETSIPISLSQDGRNDTISFKQIAYGSGKFVTLGYNSDKVIYSFDGITLLAHKLPDVGNWNSIAYGNGRFVAVEGTTDVIYGQET